jgi:hypothetical protein
MGINVGRLEDLLLEMSSENAPGRDFCDSISELARTGRFAQLREVLPGIVYDELWARYQQDADAFIVGWRMLAQEMRQGFIQHARQRLTSLTKMQYAGYEAPTPAWKEIQRALDAQQNDLLRTAFALELLEMVEPAVQRATHLRGGSAQLGGGRPLPGRGDALLLSGIVYRLRGHVPLRARRGDQAEAPHRAYAAGSQPLPQHGHLGQSAA